MLAVSNIDRVVGRGKKKISIDEIDYLPSIVKSIFAIGEDKNVNGRRLLVQLKNSFSPLQKAITFSLDEEKGLIWNGICDATIEDLMQPRNEKKIRNNSAYAVAKSFVLDILRDGPVTSKRMEAEAQAAGISKTTLDRVRAQLGDEDLIFTKKGVREWTWQMKFPVNNKKEGSATESSDADIYAESNENGST